MGKRNARRRARVKGESKRVQAREKEQSGEEKSGDKRASDRRTRGRCLQVWT